MSDFKYISLGWWGYLICASIYLGAAALDGDVSGTLGSAFFFAATASFMVPHYRKHTAKTE